MKTQSIALKYRRKYYTLASVQKHAIVLKAITRNHYRLISTRNPDISLFTLN